MTLIRPHATWIAKKDYFVIRSATNYREPARHYQLRFYLWEKLCNSIEITSLHSANVQLSDVIWCKPSDNFKSGALSSIEYREYRDLLELLLLDGQNPNKPEEFDGRSP